MKKNYELNIYEDSLRYDIRVFMIDGADVYGRLIKMDEEEIELICYECWDRVVVNRDMVSYYRVKSKYVDLDEMFLCMMMEE